MRLWWSLSVVGINSILQKLADKKKVFSVIDLRYAYNNQILLADNAKHLAGVIRSGVTFRLNVMSSFGLT